MSACDLNMNGKIIILAMLYRRGVLSTRLVPSIQRLIFGRFKITASAETRGLVQKYQNTIWLESVHL